MSKVVSIEDKRKQKEKDKRNKIIKRILKRHDRYWGKIEPPEQEDEE